MKAACHFVVVDDHQLFAEGLVRILQEASDFIPVAVLSNVDALWDITELNEVDLVLLDVQLQGVSGLDVCALIKRKYPNIKIVLISMIQAPHITKEGARLGADGFIPKTSDAEVLKATIRRIWEGEKLFLSGSLEDEPQPVNQLSERELEIIHLIKNGQSTRKIADQLFISEYTVETHRKNILRKLNINTVTELVAFAYANHL